MVRQGVNGWPTQEDLSLAAALIWLANPSTECLDSLLRHRGLRRSSDAALVSRLSGEGIGYQTFANICPGFTVDIVRVSNFDRLSREATN